MTVVATYSALILASLLVLALLAIVICEIARRQRWKYYGVDITYLARNKLFCQIYNRSGLSSDEDCIEDAKDLVLVATSDKTGNTMRITVENRNEIHLLEKMQVNEHVV